MIKKLPIIALGLALMASCSSNKRVNSSHRNYHIKRNTKTHKKPVKTNTKSTAENPTLADKIIWSAFKYRGTKYRYGGTSKSGMDCSGLVMVSFKERGISLPRSSYDMSKQGYKIPLSKVKRGDLVFFYTNPRKPGRVTHVGLVTHIKDGTVQFLHASTKRGVVLNKMNERYYKKNFAFAKRVLD